MGQRANQCKDPHTGPPAVKVTRLTKTHATIEADDIPLDLSRTAAGWKLEGKSGRVDSRGDPVQRSRRELTGGGR